MLCLYLDGRMDGADECRFGKIVSDREGISGSSSEVVVVVV
jgi:hypothetical protein